MFLVLVGPSAVVTLPLPVGARVVVGRNVVDDRRVSREHAAFEHHADGRITIEDLESRYGTIVARNRVRPHKPSDFDAETSCSLGGHAVWLEPEGSAVRWVDATEFDALCSTMHVFEVHGALWPSAEVEEDEQTLLGGLRAFLESDGGDCVLVTRRSSGVIQVALTEREAPNSAIFELVPT